MTEREDKAEKPFDLKLLVDKALKKFLETETRQAPYPPFEEDNREPYLWWMVGDDVVEEVIEQTGAEIKDVALSLVGQTSLMPRDLETSFSGGAYNWDLFWEVIAGEIISVELTRQYPQVLEIDSSRRPGTTWE